MSIDDAIKRITALVDSLETEMPAISEEIAMNTMAIVVNRIQQEGIPGKRYSTEKLPYYYFHGRALNSGGLRLDQMHSEKRMRDIQKKRGEKVRKKKRIDELEPGISYKEWREANGLQTAHVDLTYSGRMFQNLGIIGTTRQGNTFVTVIGGFDKEVKDKLRWNAERFGNFLMVNDQEREELKIVWKARLLELFKKNGL